MGVAPRRLDPTRDLPAVAELLGRTRAAGGIWLPGGIQWWLRDLALGRDDFEAFLVDLDGEPHAFVLRDTDFIIAESDDRGPSRADLVDWATDHLRSVGSTQVLTSAVEGSQLHHELSERGFGQEGTSFELMSDTNSEPPRPTLPDGFRFVSLEDVDDETYIDGHRGAWSDKRPSPYRRELHDAVKRSPQFRPDLVTIALAPNGTVASYCIGWLDDQSQDLEIEPLGTHRDYRRMGLATAVVHEVTHRAWANGAKHVLVWNDPKTNPGAYGLYTGAGMLPRRTLAELTKTL